MAAKELLFDESARRAIERGVNILADAVHIKAGLALHDPEIQGSKKLSAA